MRPATNGRTAKTASNRMELASAPPSQDEPVPPPLTPSLRTRAVHAGAPAIPPVWPLGEPIAPSVVYACRDPAVADGRAVADPPEPNYARDGLPNVRSLERAVAELEGAMDAQATASGMAAIALLCLAHLRAGDHVVAFAQSYGETRAFLTEELPRFGVRATIVDDEDPQALRAAIGSATRLLLAETIANPSLRLADLAGLAALAHRHDALLCVDNTFATPLLCRPLDHGADLVLHSATKLLGGHHDLLAGVVAGRRDLIAPIRSSCQRYGMTLGAMDAWLAVRGLHTLAPRIAWMSATAAALAAFLAAHPAIAAVHYPGLPSHPQATLARTLLPNGAGPMLAFELAGGPPSASRLIRALRLIPYALSLGGTTTTICCPLEAAPPRAGVVGTPRTLLRLSVGLEAVDDLIADLDEALAQAVPRTA